MNPNYTHTITLYSRIKAEDTKDRKERWIRTVLPSCFWKNKIVTEFSGTQASAANAYIVRIPENPNYRKYRDFIKAPENCFTVSQDDIVILGECAEEITGKPGQTAVQVLSRNKPDAFKVTAFSNNTSFPLARHYRLGG